MTTTLKDVRQVVGQGDFVTRAEIARRLNRNKTGYLIALIEKAVDHGYLQKLPGYANGRECWRYCLPGTQLSLLIADLEPDPGYETHALRMEIEEIDRALKGLTFDGRLPVDYMRFSQREEYYYLRDMRDRIKHAICAIEDTPNVY